MNIPARAYANSDRRAWHKLMTRLVGTPPLSMGMAALA